MKQLLLLSLVISMISMSCHCASISGQKLREKAENEAIAAYEKIEADSLKAIADSVESLRKVRFRARALYQHTSGELWQSQYTVIVKMSVGHMPGDTVFIYGMHTEDSTYLHNQPIVLKQMLP